MPKKPRGEKAVTLAFSAPPEVVRMLEELVARDRAAHPNRPRHNRSRVVQEAIRIMFELRHAKSWADAGRTLNQAGLL